MMRAIYRGLLCLHPPAFRREFGYEMLWIFDETRGAAAIAMLMGDAAVSLARQWLLRSGAWKLLAAAAGGIFQITIGGLAFAIFHQLHPAARSEPGPASPEMLRLICLAVGVTGGIAGCVIGLALWVRNFTGRRLHHDGQRRRSAFAG